MINILIKYYQSSETNNKNIFILNKIKYEYNIKLNKKYLKH